REGHSRVAKEHIEDGYALGSWVGVQRAWYAAGRLSAGRAARLSALSGWVWNTLETAWEEGFSNLSRYVQGEGHAAVPSDWIEDGWKLGQWVGVQRARRSRLPDVRRRRLEALPGWVWGLRESSWERAYRALTSFAEREGHARPSARHREDG